MTDMKAQAGVRDPDFAGAEIAMRRAAKKVREEARMHGRPIVVVREGRIVKEIPGPEEDESGVDAAGSGG